ncbi:MAG: DUF4105 domain-containing protein [Paludibacter sp.]|nr:DUF4105 domain-containing protein [Bacteroidales bacterium]MCM1069790.1 DUF4105 domain-containing protein [Prevotella sp.]MCM1354512.1 DUF4105 domain-containing protein [Bacteroides sp.]MCM1443315.1 DUF4105 domain-containing protein [Muribaculum sp.]MCM1482439.1 DUF4105 domain-containing protein [Paludibacter sp.]
MKRLTVLLFSIGLAVMLFAQSVRADSVMSQPDRLADDFVKVSLMIAEPGDVLYSILGHVCLHLQCPFYDLDYVFSYESEDVKGRVARFLLNDLKMGMFPITLDDYLLPYAEEGRGVCEYALNLPPEVKVRLWQVLDEKVLEGTNFPYDYIKRGCAISVVHCLHAALGELPIVYPDWGKPFDRTLREIFYDNSPVGWQRFYAMTLVGGEVDNPHLSKEDKLIAPSELLSTWQHSTVCGLPLVDAEAHELLPSVNHNEGDAFTPLHAALIVLLLALGSLFWKRPYIDWAILALQTVIGILMTWLFFSPLPGTEWSWLIIPFNPLPLLLWHYRRYWTMPYLLLLMGWIIGMLCAPHRLVEAAHIIGVIAFMVVLLKPYLRKGFESVR